MMNADGDDGGDVDSDECWSNVINRWFHVFFSPEVCSRADISATVKVRTDGVFARRRL